MEVHAGFAIITSPQGVIEDNAFDKGIELQEEDWAQISAGLERMEINAVQFLAQAFGSARNEGHDANGDLIGSVWIDASTLAHAEILERFEYIDDTAICDFDGLESIASPNLFEGVNDLTQSLVDGQIELFDLKPE